MKHTVTHYHDQKDHLTSFWKRFVASIKLVFGNKQFLLFGLAMVIISIVIQICLYWSLFTSDNKVLFIGLQTILNIGIIVISIITIMGGYLLIKQKAKEDIHTADTVTAGSEYIWKYIQGILRILWKNIRLLVPAIVFIILAMIFKQQIRFILYIVSILIFGIVILGYYSFPWIFIVLKGKQPKDAVLKSKEFSSSHVTNIIWQFIRMSFVGVFFLLIILIPIMGLLMTGGVQLQESILFNNILSGIIAPFLGLIQVVFTWLLYLKYSSKKTK